ncbi:hypothetical protein HYT45_00190 [Candidatus Uhrbacteria bacterium]|nr:hypothetical protein [Candidatus Uhrbacteria bacterium]
MRKGSSILAVVALVILAGGAGYYLWDRERTSNIPNVPNEEVIPQEGSSFLDTFFEKLKPSDKPAQSNLKEYKDSKGIFSITYPSSWAVRPDQGRRLTGANITPRELLDRYSSEEQGFVKGLVVSADESEESPESYFKKLVGDGATGQTEAGELTINGYPAYMVKGNISGISYIIYIVSHNDRIVYFNYRSHEEESAHQNDIKKAVNFGPYIADFEAAVHSIKFLK